MSESADERLLNLLNVWQLPDASSMSHRCRCRCRSCCFQEVVAVVVCLTSPLRLAASTGVR